MKQLTYDLIKEVAREKGYCHNFNELTIIGVRTNFDLPDSFNDYLLCTWVENGEGKMFGGMATTDPSVYWLNKPMNVKGTAIVQPNMYNNVWTIGNHHEYKALVQCGSFKTWRDGNKDSQLDRTGDTIIAGPECGINCHRAYEGFIVKTIGKYSAGCQVWQNSKLFDKMMDLAYKSKQKTFTYILFTENDFS